MKPLTLLLLSLIIFTSSTFAQRKWEIAGHAFPEGEDGAKQHYFGCVDCLDKLNCVTAGSDYVEEDGISMNRDLIWRTTDGGATWQRQISPRPKYLGRMEAFNDVCMVDSLNIFIVGDSGAILRTTDGGNEWQELPELSKKKYNDVDFFDKDHGIVCGSERFISITSDGGNTWHVYDAVYPAYYVSCKGLSPTSYYVMNRWEQMFMTHDRGASWDTLAIYENDSGSIPFKQTYASVMFDSLHYIVCGAHKTRDTILNSDSYITKTTDGGLTWTTLFDQGPNLYSHLNDIDFADEQFGVATGSITKLILLTSDGGASWFSDSVGVDIGFILAMNDVDMPSRDRIFITSPTGPAAGYLLQWRGEYLHTATQLEIENTILVSGSSDKTLIQNLSELPFDYSIIDILGRHVQSGNSSGAPNVLIGTQGLSNGSYTVIVKDKESVSTRQFVVSR